MMKPKDEYFELLCRKIGCPTDSPAAAYERPLFDVVYEMIADAVEHPQPTERKGDR